jgi:hypothetical protein
MVTQAVQADGSTTSYEYKDNTVKTTDPAGKWKTVTTDEFSITDRSGERLSGKR